ncbi:MAG: hypothetical protein JKX80_01855, partial [Candidatus Pacebacteria bacterium]|nr:hypothetical protein [Candidatus Paceibacterota bacterium]
MKNPKIKFVFFGTPKLSVIVLDELKMKELTPSLIVTAPDKPSGRGMKMHESPVAGYNVDIVIHFNKSKKLAQKLKTELEE